MSPIWLIIIWFNKYLQCVDIVINLSTKPKFIPDHLKALTHTKFIYWIQILLMVVKSKK